MTTTTLTRSAAMLALAAACSLAHAAAPMAKFQAPGFYRTTLGEFEVTVLNDGTIDLPVDQLLKQPAAKTNAALARSFLKTPVETSINAFLINTGSKLVLIDAGAASLFGPTAGKLLANFKASGYKPEQVDEIYISHMHGDHVGGLSANDQRVFPNAVVRAGKLDADYYLSQSNLDKATGDGKEDFRGVMISLNPYVKAGKFQPIVANSELVPGIKSYFNGGHTPGHITYVVESAGQKLVLLGDLLHVQAVQFENPGVGIAFDTDSKVAIAERREAFAAAAKDGYLIGAPHLSFPALGHVRSNGGKGYEFVPVNYALPR
ncbi:MBL fold metallo-hydrolase [Duganella sp. BJB488]|uniref:MBL fold metallo-hydrolase n=1 Tax=unclassified Duganella TaxID=2636909 RepID=UPI000E34390A|nr:MULTISPECIES: MBL fold metallo-hydrolase [unclassified Duganella]NVD74167.1 MBL fold metallo-hydrolase [Duganella sp. BJB1802]RFP21547.1 MBL fold metallo-hydrolase [Duganella sp. BJB489]RFP23340.1 MBL fold metallo-hydrolase [Duganella sp. BJB488]RFP38506.1 MBL fold metallo-hydrolase [Duganella sp. BJB480]